MSFRAVSSGFGRAKVAAIGGCLLLACVNRGEHETIGDAVIDGSRAYDARIDRGGSGGARADAAFDSGIDRGSGDAPRDATGAGGSGTGGETGTGGSGGGGAGGSGTGGKTGTGGSGAGGKIRNRRQHRRRRPRRRAARLLRAFQFRERKSLRRVHQHRISRPRSRTWFTRPTPRAAWVGQGRRRAVDVVDQEASSSCRLAIPRTWPARPCRCR